MISNYASPVDIISFEYDSEFNFFENKEKLHDKIETSAAIYKNEIDTKHRIVILWTVSVFYENRTVIKSELEHGYYVKFDNNNDFDGLVDMVYNSYQFVIIAIAAQIPSYQFNSTLLAKDKEKFIGFAQQITDYFISS